MYMDDGPVKYRETYLDGHSYHFTVPCINCNEVHEIEVKGDELFYLRRGAHIQDALRSNTNEERELLLSGTCGSCWDSLFPEEESE